jgi:hypothetical protein
MNEQVPSKELSPCQVPLLEQLRSTPLNAHHWLGLPNGEARNIPYGPWCHSAADELERLQRAITTSMQRLSNGDVEGGARVLRECFWGTAHEPPADARLIRALVEITTGAFMARQVSHDTVQSILQKHGISGQLIDADGTLRAALPPGDSERLDFIAAEYLHVIPFDMPTGGGDADVGWRVLQSHQGKGDVEIAAAHRDDLREAIDAARTALTKGENHG